MKDFQIRPIWTLYLVSCACVSVTGTILRRRLPGGLVAVQLSLP